MDTIIECLLVKLLVAIILRVLVVTCHLCDNYYDPLFLQKATQNSPDQKTCPAFCKDQINVVCCFENNYLSIIAMFRKFCNLFVGIGCGVCDACVYTFISYSVLHNHVCFYLRVFKDPLYLPHVCVCVVVCVQHIEQRS